MEVLRGGVFRPLPSTALVPGDVVAVVPGTLPADCVLLTGECIVDENMLTGALTRHHRSNSDALDCVTVRKEHACLEGVC